MNIITAAKAETQTRQALLDTYTDDHVSDYTAAALTYSDHRDRALFVAELLIGIANVGLALYNIIQAFGGNASSPLILLSVVFIVASLAVHKFRRGTNSATIKTINTTVAVALHARGPERN